MEVSDTPTGFRVDSENGSVQMSIQGESAFGHDWYCNSEDASEAASLLLTARTELKKRGLHSFMVHIPIEDQSLGEFWLSVGGKPLFMAIGVDV